MMKMMMALITKHNKRKKKQIQLNQCYWPFQDEPMKKNISKINQKRSDFLQIDGRKTVNANFQREREREERGEQGESKKRNLNF